MISLDGPASFELVPGMITDLLKDLNWPNFEGNEGLFSESVELSADLLDVTIMEDLPPRAERLPRDTYAKTTEHN